MSQKVISTIGNSFTKLFDILNTSNISEFNVYIEEDENQTGTPIYYIVAVPPDGAEADARRVATVYSDTTGENDSLAKNNANNGDAKASVAMYDASALADLYALVPLALTKLQSVIQDGGNDSNDESKQYAITKYLIGIIYDYYASHDMTDDETRLWQSLSGIIDNVPV